jgi:t-SNARE complex subunit (syntaxin)
VDDLTTAPGIAALAAGGLALFALLVSLLLARRLRSLRRAQSVVLGDGGERDLAAHAQALQSRFEALADQVERNVGDLRARAGDLDRRLDGAVTHCAVVRYDAMNEMTGRQSSSVALLDSHRSGVVISSILHRDQARLYAKQIVDGRSELELSPEEEEAVGVALRDGAR